MAEKPSNIERSTNKIKRFERKEGRERAAEAACNIRIKLLKTELIQQYNRDQIEAKKLGLAKEFRKGLKSEIKGDHILEIAFDSENFWDEFVEYIGTLLDTESLVMYDPSNDETFTKEMRMYLLSELKTFVSMSLDGVYTDENLSYENNDDNYF